jgi:hypothetical protein
MNFLKKNYRITHFNIAGLKKQLRTISAVLILLFITQSTFAQQGINYKAVIKDASGNIMADQNITVQFGILQNITNVYTETHTPTTDGNGIVILNIGEGTIVNGDYTTIDWGSDTHFLNVQIDTGTGLVDLGTTQFKAVPYALQAANVTGLEKITETGNTGWRLLGQEPANYGPIGAEATDLSTSISSSTTKGATGTFSLAMGKGTTASGFHSTAMGENTTASGNASIAMGTNTTASGQRSTAMGRNTIASESSSTAMGESTIASGPGSTAMGVVTTASGVFSTAMGGGTTAQAYISTAMGRYNVGGGSGATWVDTDKIFEIGIGESATNRKNALTILKNGKVGISTTNPNTKLHITNGVDASMSSGTGYLVLGDITSLNLVFDENEIIARNNGANSTLFLQKDGGDVNVGGSVVHASDRRLKKEITTLPYGLKEVLQLQPKAYHWKNRVQKHRSLGLIAQEVQPLIKEIVQSENDANKTLSINYTALIPVLINAIKEQQDIINNLQSMVGSQQSKINLLMTVTSQEAVDDRIEQLEFILKSLQL